MKDMDRAQGNIAGSQKKGSQEHIAGSQKKDGKKLDLRAALPLQ